MSPSQYTPLASALKAFQYLFTGRIHLHKDQVGAEWTGEQGQRFTVFRSLEVDPDPGSPLTPLAVFVARFRIAGMPVGRNQRFSWLPIPFYIGLPGFRSKRWMVNEERGEFAGYYEWDTPAAAERYAGSFAAKFMTSRAEPGSFSGRVYPRAEAPPPPMAEGEPGEAQAAELSDLPD